MGQAIKLETLCARPVEPVQAPTVWFTVVDLESIRVEKGVVHFDLVEERPGRDGSGPMLVTVGHLKTPYDPKRENFATIVTRIVTLYRQTPEGQREAMI